MVKFFVMGLFVCGNYLVFLIVFNILEKLNWIRILILKLWMLYRLFFLCVEDYLGFVWW